MAISTALALFSAIVGAAGAAQQGRDAKKQASAQEDAARAQAANEREIAAASERDFRRNQSAAFGELRAGRGTSGTESSTGSALLASEDFLNEVDLQAQRIRRGGEIRSTRLEQQADLYRMSGRAGQRAGYARAGASLLSGLSDYYAPTTKTKK